MPAEPQTHCGVVALIGAPNAGKSTLVNAIVGQKVAIVSPKVQTTRVRLTGVALQGGALEGGTQMLLVDTPGIFQPKRRLDRAMVQNAWEGAADADILLALVDARGGLRDEVRAVLETIAARPEPRWLVLNKVDIADKAKLLALAAEANAIAPFAETFMVSALSGDGVADLKAALARAMPEGPWLFPEDQLSDAPARMMATELVREQLFLQLGQELPYATAVQCEKFEERPDGSAAVHAQIFVDRDSQKGIVVGARGAKVKAIGEAARAEMEALLGRRVHLFLHVKVKPGWADDRHSWRDLGMDWVD
ncbi:GTPase Era [Sandaracinobacter sp. RS1-74]|uniref:GTPase Era n=1 Tax=Sandaracinobacteroides sayramensis TaxID=2913411 RepID=UPI001EDAE2F8|nr:GTPase Era [Sandaracinobacteroides sayramensis]MCG2840979.1 GTPase Era [Sandaracinobacteroides sayramensis]